MNFSFIADYPLWYTLLCLLLGFGFAALLYWANPSSKFSRVINVTLFAFRFLTASLILFLLLGPYLKQLKKETEPPVILMAHDNSASIILTPDSSWYKGAYLQLLDSTKLELEKSFLLSKYLFGQQVREESMPDFGDQFTEISSLFSHLGQKWANKNVGGLVLFSDGIFNRGVNPAFALQNINFPVFVVALGDTTIRPDLAIRDLRYNRIVYQNTRFPVEVTVTAREAAGQTAMVRILQEGKVLHEQPFIIPSPHYSRSYQFEIDPKRSGQQRYLAEITGLDQEVNLTNNRREFYVDVIERKQHVLILAAAPHPDIGAIRSVLDDYYDITTHYSNDRQTTENQYNIVIVHQMPQSLADFRIIRQMMENDPMLPFLFISGRQTSLSHFNNMQDGLGIQQGRREQMIDAFPLVEETFSLFTLEKAFRDRIMHFPPLSVHFGEYVQPIGSHSFIYQKISGIETDKPMVSFHTSTDGRKLGFINGTGIWRWRFHDFNRNGNHAAFNDFVSKTINYLTIQLDARRLRVYIENEHLVNDEIRFEASLYNASMELVNEPELLLIVTHEDDNTQYTFTFSRNENNTYQLNAGRLPEGAYTYRATANFMGEDHAFSGAFRIVRGSLEALQTVADHHLLNEIARLSEGKMLYPGQVSTLPDLLKNDNRITSVARYNTRYEPLIGFGWLFALVAAFLFAEWLIRKTNGSY